jgi:hypothetical protein
MLRSERVATVAVCGSGSRRFMEALKFFLKCY